MPALGVMVVATAGVAAVGWIVAIIEGVAMLFFQPWAFDLGPVATKRELATNAVDPFAHSTEGTADTTVYRVTGGRCFFRGRAFPLRRRFRTPFEIKGTMSWNGRVVTVIGRFPLGSTVFLCAWFVIWSTVTVMWAIRGGSIAGEVFLVVGWVAVVVAVDLSRRYERRRFEATIDEVLSRLR